MVQCLRKKKNSRTIVYLVTVGRNWTIERFYDNETVQSTVASSLNGEDGLIIGKKSMIEVDEKIYKKIMTVMF